MADASSSNPRDPKPSLGFTPPPGASSRSGAGGAPLKGRHVPPMAPPPKYVPMRPRFEASKAPMPAKARKVRGGIKLAEDELASAGPSAWAAQRWLRLLERAAEGPNLVEGKQYANEGQTKRWGITSSASAGTIIDAAVQGRAPRPYTTTLSLSQFSHEQWDRVVEAMAGGAIYAAKLLSGELPPSIEDVFSPLSLKLFPTEPSDVKVTCTCGHSQAPRPQTLREGETADGTLGWCKHACCVSYLVSNRLATEPFLMFTLRGLDANDLVDRLKARRAVVGAALGSTPIYQQRVAGVADARVAPLEETVASFWRMDDKAVEHLDIAPEPPKVTHPLLRRLGPSPWTGQAQFPLVGLLASCYDTISGRVVADDASAGPESIQDVEGDQAD